MSPTLDEIRAAVDADLEHVFAVERARAERLSGDTLLVDAFAALTMRGGKRLRPAVLVAAYRAVGGGDSLAPVLPACSALELLQSYLLVHDDWMDGDTVRRGGPSVHAALRAHVGSDALGDALAILAGDLGSTLAWARLLDTRAEPAVLARLLGAFADIQREVVLGQQLDVMGSPDVSRMQQLKTGSYTVGGPIRLGAILGGAGADGAALSALDAFAAPLGEAFQVADDLLGTFGDPAKTGKPAGNDLRAGKRTALVRAAAERLAPRDRAPLDRVLGRADADEDEIEAARSLLVEHGVRADVEARLGALLADAQRALDTPALTVSGRAMLASLADTLARRAA